MRNDFLHGGREGFEHSDKARLKVRQMLAEDNA